MLLDKVAAYTICHCNQEIDIQYNISNYMKAKPKSKILCVQLQSDGLMNVTCVNEFYVQSLPTNQVNYAIYQYQHLPKRFGLHGVLLTLYPNKGSFL